MCYFLQIDLFANEKPAGTKEKMSNNAGICDCQSLKVSKVLRNRKFNKYFQSKNKKNTSPTVVFLKLRS